MMMMMERAKEYVPHLLMIAGTLALSVFIVVVKSAVSGGMSGPVFVFYQNLLSTFFISILALLFERNTRPALSFHLLSWTFFLGLIQVPIAQLMQTLSLRFVSATFQSTAMNTLTAVTFLLAVAFRQETFRFLTINGQVKLWGIALSTAGATLIVLWHGPELRLPAQYSSENGNSIIGYLMVASSILATAFCNLLLERVTMRYRAVMSLSTLIFFFGAIQVGVVACLTETSSNAWKIGLKDSAKIVAVLYGGTVTGLLFYVQAWCVYKKGPVFVSAFCPLLIVFCFILEALLLKKATYLGSIVGAVFVVVGLYALLWAKADDQEKVKLLEEESTSTPLLNSPKSITESVA